MYEELTQNFKKETGLFSCSEDNIRKRKRKGNQEPHQQQQLCQVEQTIQEYDKSESASIQK